MEKPARHRRWFLAITTRTALVIGVVFHIFGFFIFKVLSYPEPRPREIKPFLVLAEPRNDLNNRILQEQAVLFDTVPLFLPSVWNVSGAKDVQEEFQKINQPMLFSPFPEQITINEELMMPSLTANSQNEGSVSAKSLLALKYWDFFTVYGMQESDRNAFPERIGFIELYNMKSGELVDTQIIEMLEENPENTELIRELLWSPMTLMIRVENGLMKGEPLLIEDSGNGEINRIMRAYLADSFSLSMLETGNYQAVIGP